MHSDLVVALEQEAAVKGLSRGQLIELILNDYLNGDSIELSK
ncbi:lexA regulated protein [Glaesserella parasuis D74]|nr:lexA regulated protein [Glaesserella parasuis D74]EQA12146.1 lexA regulated protein [Glaesserella parasuis SW140]